jgi:hypothetical protein
MTKEKQRLQCLVESVQRRADDLEKTNEVATQQAETWKSEAQLVPQLRTQCSTSQAKVESLERENQNVHRELAKLRESVEVRLNKTYGLSGMWCHVILYLSIGDIFT